jgi:hypothetical protein
MPASAPADKENKSGKGLENHIAQIDKRTTLTPDPTRRTPNTLPVFVANPPEKSPEPHDAAEASPYNIATISGFAILPSVKAY